MIVESDLGRLAVDAVPFMIETEGIDPEWDDFYGDPHEYLRELREFMQRRKGDATFLGEVNVSYAEQVKFFGGKECDELSMMFDFELMQRMCLSLARQDATAMATMLKKRPKLARHNQFANFVRNHDELTSRVPSLPPEGAYGPAHVNAEQQRGDDDSLLSFIGTLARRYRECPEVGMGDFEVLGHQTPSVLAHRCTWNQFGGGSASSVLVHNLSPEPTEVTLDLADVPDVVATDLLTHERCRVDTKGSLTVTMDGYGHRWLRLLLPGDRRLR